MDAPSPGRKASDNHAAEAASSAHRGHWVSQLSSAQLLSAADHEWRPWLRLVRKVSAAETWDCCCAALREELAAITAATDIGLCLIQADDVRRWDVVGQVQASEDLLQSDEEIASEGETLCARLASAPKLWLVLSPSPAPELVKTLLVVAGELGEALLAHVGESTVASQMEQPRLGRHTAPALHQEDIDDGAPLTWYKAGDLWHTRPDCPVYAAQATTRVHYCVEGSGRDREPLCSCCGQWALEPLLASRLA